MGGAARSSSGRPTKRPRSSSSSSGRRKNSGVEWLKEDSAMKQATLALLALAALVPAQAERKLTEGDRTRFLYISVLEGLWEDGADRPMLEALLANPWKLFV